MFEGIVKEDLDVEILAGNPLMTANDVAVRPAKRDVFLGNGPISTWINSPPNRSKSFVLCVPAPSKTVWPGEFVTTTPPPADSE